MAKYRQNPSHSTATMTWRDLLLIFINARNASAMLSVCEVDYRLFLLILQVQKPIVGKIVTEPALRLGSWLHDLTLPLRDEQILYLYRLKNLNSAFIGGSCCSSRSGWPRPSGVASMSRIRSPSAVKWMSCPSCVLATEQHAI